MAEKHETKKYSKRRTSENLDIEKIKKDIDVSLNTKLDYLKDTILSDIKSVIDKSLDEISEHFNKRIEDIERKIENFFKKSEKESNEVSRKVEKCEKKMAN